MQAPLRANYAVSLIDGYRCLTSAHRIRLGPGRAGPDWSIPSVDRSVSVSGTCFARFGPLTTEASVDLTSSFVAGVTALFCACHELTQTAASPASSMDAHPHYLSYCRSVLNRPVLSRPMLNSSFCRKQLNFQR